MKNPYRKITRDMRISLELLKLIYIMLYFLLNEVVALISLVARNVYN